MNFFISTHLKRNLYTLIVASMLVVFAMPASAVTPVDQAKLLADDGAEGDLQGFSVAISGDTIITGAIKGDNANGVDAGSAYVFTRTDNVWRQQAKLTATAGAAGDSFGGKVALSGDTAVVGAIFHDSKGDDSGAAYVFTRSGENWGQQSKIIGADTDAGDSFGQSIAIYGDTLVIGAPHDGESISDAGSVYVFVRSGNVWIQQAKLTAADGGEGDVFGISTALYGDTLLIGADLNAEKGFNSGAAYVFVRSRNVWEQQAKLTAADAGEGDIFGVRVALSGDTALISARRDDDDVMGVDAGSAYVFTRSDTVWHQQAKLTAADGSADDRFGRDVALSGDTAVIGAMFQDDKGERSGSVYVFTRSGDSWSMQTKLMATDGEAGDALGFSVAFSADSAVVGAARDDDNGEQSGSAYVFDINDNK